MKRVVRAQGQHVVWRIAAAAMIGVAVAGPALSAPPAAAAPRPAGPPEPEIRRVVLEDDAVRIEELRVRGQVQRISVTPKTAGARPFEIVPPDPARDVSQQRGLTGQRLWNVWSF